MQEDSQRERREMVMVLLEPGGLNFELELKNNRRTRTSTSIFTHSTNADQSRCTVADDYGISHETIRRLICAARHC